MRSPTTFTHATEDFASYAIEESKKVSFNKIIILTIIEKRDGEVFNFAKVFSLKEQSKIRYLIKHIKNSYKTQKET